MAEAAASLCLPLSIVAKNDLCLASGMEVLVKKSKTAAELGASGGRARAQKLSREERSEIARQAATKRWESRPATFDGILKATHQAPLDIGGVKIPVAVLEDGTRVLSQTGFIRAIGRTGNVRGSGGLPTLSAFQLPVFLQSPNLKPFIPEDLIKDSAPIPFIPKGKGGNHIAYGFRSDFLPRVCNVFTDAKEAGALRGGQMHIYERCRLLSRGFGIVGITALIDEATGYQEVRDRLALQAILDRFLRKELAAWAKRFPNEFYQHIFRLKGWTLNELSQRRPGVVGKYTNDIVYARLAPSLLRELQRVNPKNDRGHRPARHHQWLTEDVGHPALAQHLYAVVGFMRVATTWDEFYRMLERAFPKRGTTPLLEGLD